MYQALYRKYRPRTFEDVVGQEAITQTLLHQVEEKKTAHAYLFTGSRGTGKTTCSKILAKAVNCLSPQGGNPCGECEICRGIDDGSILDVVEMDAASWGGVDNIRQLREEAFFSPVKARFRVYIIDECHMLSMGAFNALLKIMEEPPAYVLFILATTEVHKVPPTILSRCQRFDFRRIPSEVIAKRLQAVAQQEEIQLTEEGALLVGRIADGGMRDALSILDLCASYSRQVDGRAVAEAAGLLGNEEVALLCEALCYRDVGGAFSLLDKLYNGSSDMERVCDQLITTLRHVMIIKAAPNARDLVAVSQEQYAQLSELAGGVGMERVLSILDILQETLGRLARAGNKRVEMEMGLIRAASGGGFWGSTGDIQGARDAQGLPHGGNNGPAGNTGIPDTASIPEEHGDIHGDNHVQGLPMGTGPRGEGTAALGTALPASTPSGSWREEQGDAMEGNPSASCSTARWWGEVLGRLATLNPALCGALQGSKAYVQGDLVLIDAPDALFLKLIRQSDYTKESIRQAIQAETGRKYRLGPYRPPVQESRQEDPLRMLEETAREAGIDVSVTGR